MRQKSEKELYIINNYANKSQKQLALDLGIPVSNVQYYVKKNNLRKDKFRFTKEEKDFIKQHYLDMEYSKIGELLGGYTERQIRGCIANMKLRKNRKINDHYFDKIDTSLKAYLLGFIFADGWIVYNPKSRNYELGMELQSQDRYILEKLNEELGNKNIIYHSDPHTSVINGNTANSGPMDCLRVYSKNLVLGLMNNGIATNKSQKDIYPMVCDEFFFDFLRGYIDGDGCYYEYKKHYYMHITCASKIVLSYIKTRLLNFNIETRIYKENDKKYRLMCVNTAEMEKLINKLYYTKDLFCLSRKYVLIKSYLSGLAA